MLTLKKVAVTGGLAAGKTTVCRLLESLGAYVVSADEITHQLLSPQTALGQQVINLLGSNILNGNLIDRSKIAERVFSHPEKLKALENLVHPAVIAEIKKRYEQVKQKDYSLFVAEVPLLYESKADTFFDCVISVIADKSVCESRYQQLTGKSPEEYRRRMSRQLSQEEKAVKANYTLVNNGTLQELKTQVKTIYKELCV